MKNPTTQQIKTLQAETSPALHSRNSTWASLSLMFWCLMQLKSSDLTATDTVEERNKEQLEIITALFCLGITCKSNCDHSSKHTARDAETSQLGELKPNSSLKKKGRETLRCFPILYVSHW